MRSDLLEKADIVISSYLGDTQAVRKQRFEYHIKQRIALRALFSMSNFKIVTVAAGWPPAYKEPFLNKFHKFHGSASDILFTSAKPKAKIHNMVFDKLYKQDNKSVLLLDDDVFPTDMDDLDTDCIEFIFNCLNNPSLMPAPCVYFSCKGTLRDTYYLKRKGGYSATHAVTGWATLVHSSLKVRFKPEDLTFEGEPIFDDIIFRFKVASKYMDCVKCQDLFFESYQSPGTDKYSVWCKDREHRRELVKRSNRAVMAKFPWLLQGTSTEKKLVPIWMVKGQKRRALIRSGMLRSAPFGGATPTKKLKEQYAMELENSQRKGLLDLLEES